MKIVPIRDLKNTVKIEEYCREENGPVFVTKNGYGRLVVMDMEYYEKSMSKIEEASLLLEGLEDIKNGNTYEGREVMNNLREKYGL